MTAVSLPYITPDRADARPADVRLLHFHWERPRGQPTGAPFWVSRATNVYNSRDIGKAYVPERNGKNQPSDADPIWLCQIMRSANKSEIVRLIAPLRKLHWAVRDEAPKGSHGGVYVNDSIIRPVLCLAEAPWASGPEKAVHEEYRPVTDDFPAAALAALDAHPRMAAYRRAGEPWPDGYHPPGAAASWSDDGMVAWTYACIGFVAVRKIEAGAARITGDLVKRGTGLYATVEFSDPALDNPCTAADVHIGWIGHGDEPHMFDRLRFSEADVAAVGEYMAGLLAAYEAEQAIAQAAYAAEQAEFEAEQAARQEAKAAALAAEAARAAEAAKEAEIAAREGVTLTIPLQRGNRYIDRVRTLTGCRLAPGHEYASERISGRSEGDVMIIPTAPDWSFIVETLYDGEPLRERTFTAANLI